MYNKHDIYLHGTNRPDQFAYKNRALSSGCVRVEKPEEITAFILGNDEDYSTHIEIGKTIDIHTEVPLPIYMYYFTVWVDDDGKVVYGRDIYGLDKKLLHKLKSIQGLHFHKGRELS